jgi:glyoxylase-like metal-dependent hydrolase (beta-lactamase superfamily II)
MRCCGCGEEFPEITGPTHDYMLSSPGCWEAYGRVLAREYESLPHAQLHRLTVDAYAVQHPGVDGRQARNSVGIHLSRLCLIFDCGWPIERANDAMQAITAKKQQYPWLTPPNGCGTVTVRDVLETQNASDHLGAVERWARSAWQAWAEHHATVHEWVEELVNR